MTNRKPPQHHLVQNRKDRRVRPDAQRKGKNGNEGKSRILRQHPQAVAYVLQERLHLQSPCAALLTSAAPPRNCPRPPCQRRSPYLRPSIHAQSRSCSPSSAPT